MDKKREFLDVFWNFFAFWTITSKNFTGKFFEEQSDDGDTAGEQGSFPCKDLSPLTTGKGQGKSKCSVIKTLIKI